MKKWLSKCECFIDKSIPYLLIILLFIIIAEIFFHDFAQNYITLFHILDNIIISFFIIDLCFKYYRLRNFKSFLKHYWLEIIAVFPFFLILRLLEEFYLIAEFGQNTQKYLHSVVEVQKESRLIIEEAEKVVARGSRSRYFMRFLRPIARVPRFFMAFSFYEKPIRK